MKSSTLNTLLVAKSIYVEAKDLISSGDKYYCTAGIILLQDFIELVVLAMLDELDVDEQRALEKKSFDELLGELKKLEIPLYKSGTIKALNKQRVIAKHYGQLTEPESTLNYFNTAETFADKLLLHLTGKKLQEIFLTELLEKGVIKQAVQNSVALAEKQLFLDALIELRKAFYLAYEQEYSVYFWSGIDQSDPPKGLLAALLLGGAKAPYWKKNKQWIRDNVLKPTDYVQIDYDQLKIDCIEWGINTVHVENFRRLTPEVVQTENNHWHTSYETSFAANESNIENFSYCLNLLLEFLLKKQEFEGRRKWPKTEKLIPAPPIYVGKPLYAKPSQESTVIHTVEADYYYSVRGVVTGFHSDERYLYVHLYKEENKPENSYLGYLLIEDNNASASH